MRREVVVLVFLVGCTTPSPVPMLGGDPVVDDVSVVPAVESPSEALRDTSVVDPSSAPREATPPHEPVIDPTIAKLGGPVCPSPASTCAPGCMAIGGIKLNEAKQCYEGITLGCLRGYAVNGDLTCAAREDGVLYQGSTTPLTRLGPGWSGCTPEQWAVFSAESPGPFCPIESAPAR